MSKYWKQWGVLPFVDLSLRSLEGGHQPRPVSPGWRPGLSKEYLEFSMDQLDQKKTTEAGKGEFPFVSTF